jgi:hypothetical protein
VLSGSRVAKERAATRPSRDHAVSLFFLGAFENSLVARYIPARFRGIGYGVKFILTYGVGALAVPIVGWATDHMGGTSTAFLYLAPLVGCVMVIALALVVLERRLGSARRAAESRTPDIPPVRASNDGGWVWKTCQ